MDILVFLVFIAIFLISILIVRKFRRSVTYEQCMVIPGPRPLPFIGNVFDVDFKRPYISLSKMVDTFGVLFKIKLFGEEAVVINDGELVRKAFTDEPFGDVFSDRPDYFISRCLVFDGCDVLFRRASKTTMLLRKLLHKGLKRFEKAENQFKDEMKRLLSSLKDTRGNDIDITKTVQRSFANLTSLLLCGSLEKDDSPEIIWEFIDGGNQMGDPGVSAVYNMVPFIKFLPGKFRNLLQKTVKARNRLLDKYYFNHKDSDAMFDTKKREGLVETLIKLRSELDKNDRETIGENHIKGVILDVVFAATETTTTTLINGFALLLEHQNVAKTIQQEIESVVGRGRRPAISDNRRMPFTMATVYEILRYSTIAPLPVPHRAQKQQSFEGYLIPKDTLILFNLWHIHHDPKVWSEPWSFKPERFLDATGNLLATNHKVWQSFLPFSAGRRECSGKSFAKHILFLYLASVLQLFDILPPESGILPDNDPRHYETGITIQVKSFRCRAVPRR